MKNLILIALLFISVNVIGQNCKYETNGIDKFTGKMTKLTKKVKLIATFSSEGFVSLQKADTTISLILSYRTSFSNSVTVNDGAELSFLLDNNKIITIKKAGIGYSLTNNQLKTLMTSKTKTLRYFFTDKSGNYKSEDIEIKSSNADDFIELTKCIL